MLANLTNRRTTWVTALLIGALVVATLFLFPILRTPLLGDDAFNSYMGAYMQYHGETWWQFWREYDARLIGLVGRWIPMTTLLFIAMWCSTQEAFPIKVCQVIAILLDMWIFFEFIRRLSTSDRFALLATILVIPTFQIRLFYDPVAGIMLGMQLIIGATLLAANLFWDYLEDSARRWKLYASVALYVFACLSYETIYLYLSLFAIIAIVRVRKTAAVARSLTPFLIVFALCVSKDLYFRQISQHLRASLPVQTTEYTIVFQPLAVLRTWFLQTAGAVPLEYFLLDPKHYFPAFRDVLFRESRLAPLLGAALVILSFLVFRRAGLDGATGLSRRRLLFVALNGALLAVLPGLPLALSPRWQSEVTPGLAYIPVYDAGFGIAALGAVLIWLVIRESHAGRAITGVLALAYSLVTLTVFQANAITLSYYDPVWNWGRENLTEALKEGLIAKAPANSSIFVDHSYPFFFDSAYIWDTRYLFFLETHQRVIIRDPLSENVRSPLCVHHLSRGICIPNEPAYELRNVPQSYNDGYVSLAQIAQIRDVAGSPSVSSDHARIVVRGSAARGSRPTNVALSLASSDFVLASSGSTYQMWDVRSSCGPIDSRAFGTGRVIGLDFGPGFLGAEHDTKNTWEWSAPESSITVSNGTASARDIAVKLLFQVLQPGHWYVKVEGGGRSDMLHVTSGSGTYYVRSLHLAPFEVQTIRLTSNAPKPPTLGDPRDIHFGVFNATASGVTC